MKKYIRLYFKFLLQYLKILMEYKGDFFIGLASFFVIQASGIIFIYIIFQRIPHLNGWNFYQIMFIYGFAQLPRGVDHLLTDNIWHLGIRLVLRGDFDRYLLRPLNPLFQIIAEIFQPDAFGELIVGTILVFWSASNMDIDMSALNILLFIVLVLFGALIYTSVKLLFGSFAFWIKQSHSIMWMAYTTSDFAKYPISIYSRVIQWTITFIVPFAFTAFFPASYFIGKSSLLVAAGGTIIVSVVLFAVAYMVWRKGMSIYESTGN
ncbi:MAG: ABC-2 family transporter protein [Clostridia bacterium]|nr:ABC-2 family transporter protein [Clostridia bacterium]